MANNLEQDIHAHLVHIAGGLQKNVKGVSQTTLSKMKKGTSGVTTKNLARIFKENGHDAAIVIKSANNKHTTIKFNYDGE